MSKTLIESSNCSDTSYAYEVLRKAMLDEEYAWAWHCNIAMAFQDEGGGHEQSNRAAARFMQTAFDIDVTKFKVWNSFEEFWRGKKDESYGNDCEDDGC